MNPQFKDTLVKDVEIDDSLPRMYFKRAEDGWRLQIDGITDAAMALEALGILDHAKQHIVSRSLFERGE